MKKIFVLDTNVLIHDPDAIFSFADNIVVLPIVAIEELDKLKKFRDELGHSARVAARNIDALRNKGKLYKGVEINDGGIFKIVLNTNHVNWPSVLKEDKNDNLILKTAYFLLEENKDKNIPVIFVSKDLNARIKASVLGLEVQDYNKEKVKMDQFEKGWLEIEVAPEIINEFYKNKGISVEKLNSNISFYPNCYLLLRSTANSKDTAIAKYNENNNMIEELHYYTKSVWGIKALNLEQKFVFDALLDPSIKLVTLVGQAGTGKTLLALASALKQTLDDNLYKKILVSRPIVPLGKDIGYLPGSKDEKLSVWMQPIFDNLYFILNQNGSNFGMEAEEGYKGKKRGSAGIADYFIETGVIELAAVTYIRGRTIPQQFIIIDEAQNLTPHEVKTIISRVGVDSKIVLTGDPFQIDNPYLDSESNGLIYVAERFKGQHIAAHIILSKSERSELASLAAELL